MQESLQIVKENGKEDVLKVEKRRFNHETGEEMSPVASFFTKEQLEAELAILDEQREPILKRLKKFK